MRFITAKGRDSDSIHHINLDKITYVTEYRSSGGEDFVQVTFDEHSISLIKADAIDILRFVSRKKKKKNDKATPAV